MSAWGWRQRGASKGCKQGVQVSGQVNGVQAGGAGKAVRARGCRQSGAGKAVQAGGSKAGKKAETLGETLQPVSGVQATAAAIQRAPGDENHHVAPGTAGAGSP